MTTLHPHCKDVANRACVPGKSALLIGATGQTGRHLLRELVDSAQFSRVVEAGRRVTTPAPESQKLEQKIVDFEKPEELEAALRGGKWDVVFITCVPVHLSFIMVVLTLHV